MWCYRRMLKIRWEDHVTNETVLQKMGESRNIWKLLARRRDRLVGHVLRHPGILGLMMEGLVEGSNGRGRPRLQYLRQIAEDVGCDTYEGIKRLSQRRGEWRAASNQSRD